MTPVSAILAPSAAASVCSGPQSLIFTKPLEVDLILYRGDTGRFRVVVSYPNGDPIDISAATWDCDVRETEDSTTTITSFTVTPIDENEIEVSIDAATSATLTTDLTPVWDLQMTLGADVTTLIKGHVFVDKDVSRA